MSLIGQSLRLAWLQPGFLMMTPLMLLSIIGQLFLSEFVVEISKGNVSLIQWYILTSLLLVFNSSVIQRLNRKITIAVKTTFKKEAYKKYAKLEYTSKQTSTATLFCEKHEKAAMSIMMIIEWGLPSLVQMLSTLTGCVYTFFRTGMLIYLPLIMGFCSLVYVLLIRKEQNYFTQLHKRLRKLDSSLKEKRNLWLPGFQSGEISTEKMTNIEFQIDNNDTTIYTQWDKVMNMTSGLSEFMIALVLIISNPSLFMTMIVVMGQLMSSLRSLTYFVNQFNRMRNDYTDYIDFWKDSKFVEIVPSLPCPKTLYVTDVQVVDGFKISACQGVLPLDLSSESKWLITGSTGHGKSTFINALLGNIFGVELSNGVPANYLSSVAYLYQNISSFPLSNISIRSVFNDSVDDNLIKDCLSRYFPEEELTQILETILKKQKEVVPNQFDALISGILSHGQKQRLWIAVKHFEMITMQKQILILDEPDQGCDTIIGMMVLKNLFETFADRTIIMISHMCNCKLSQLNIKWTHRLTLTKGVISNTI